MNKAEELKKLIFEYGALRALSALTTRGGADDYVDRFHDCVKKQEEVFTLIDNMENNNEN